MRLALLTSLVLATLGIGAGSAHAEQAGSVCQLSWWIDASPWPTDIVEAPTEPRVPLPVQWLPLGGDAPSAAALSPPALTVTVTDAVGAEVPGTVSLRGDAAAFPLPGFVYPVLWRPAAPLSPGATYTLRVVAGPATGSGFSGCDQYGGFEKTVHLSVASEPYAVGVSVDVSTEDRWQGMEFALCEEGTGSGWVACGEAPEACCRSSLVREISASVLSSFVLPNDAFLHAYDVSVTAPGASPEPQIGVIGIPELAPLIFTFPSDVAGEPPAPGAVCATVTLWDVLADRAVATASACADPADHRPAPVQDAAFCDRDRCWAIAEANRPRPDVYYGGEPGPVIDVGGGDIAAVAAVSAGARRGGGCDGSGGPLGALLVLGALLALAWVSRRRGGGAVVALLAVGGLSAALGGTARAESPVPVCVYGWWAEVVATPLAIDGAPTVPWILLPIQWTGPGTATDADLVSPSLTVTVAASDGTAVPGGVSLRPVEARPDAVGLRRAPRWRPDAPLVPGEVYTVHVVVPDPDGDAAYSGCHYNGVDRTLTVSVASTTPDPVPAPAVSLYTSDLFAPVLYKPCGELPGGIACTDHPGICCNGDIETTHVSVDFSSPLPNAGGYLAVEITVTAPGDVALTGAIYPARDGEMSFLFEPFSPPPAPETVCATAVVYDLFTDTAVANDVACADPADHRPDAAVRVCEPRLCADADPDPGPFAEPGPDADVGASVVDDVAADGGPDVIDATPGDAMPTDTYDDRSGPSGCTGGPSPGAAALVLLAGLALARRRRRLG